MTGFSTRVELHDATYQDYERLHAEMARLLFRRTIQDDNTGIWYHLPTAEYHSHGTLTVDQVINLASAAAAMTGKKYSVLTTESAGIRWENLKPVEVAATSFGHLSRS